MTRTTWFIYFLSFPKAPSGIPQALRNMSTTTSNITIQWDHVDCLERNGDISQYRVRYGITSSTERITISTAFNTTIFTATGLAPCTRYTFEVEAVNIAHLVASPPASLIVETPLPKRKLYICCHILLLH